jgi:hypothetical protein
MDGAYPNPVQIRLDAQQLLRGTSVLQTSPSLHEQRTKLERAQMGDRLRQKIASRPDRQELVHRHILEVSFFFTSHLGQIKPTRNLLHRYLRVPIGLTAQ